MPAAPPSSSDSCIPLDALLLAAVDDFGPSQLRAVHALLQGRSLRDLDEVVLTRAGVAPAQQQVLRALLGNAEALAHWRARVAIALGDDGRLLGPEQVAQLPGLASLPDCPLYLAAGAGIIPGLATRQRVGVVGTREPSADALRWTHALAAEMARRGIVVVSGGARGIDSAAHQGAVDGGGQTLCVLGGALDQERQDRPAHIEWLCQHAMLLSEIYFSTPILKWMYPRRNRLVAALAQVVLVVQGRARSGARITADWATQLGRPLLARPGAVDDARADLPNALLAAGARAVRDVDDVLRALELRGPELAGEPAPQATAQLELLQAPGSGSARRRRRRRGGGEASEAGSRPGPAAWLAELAPDARAVCEALLAEPAGLLVDELVARVSLTPQQLAGVLLPLELEGRIRRAPGPRVVVVR